MRRSKRYIPGQVNQQYLRPRQATLTPARRGLLQALNSPKTRQVWLFPVLTKTRPSGIFVSRAHQNMTFRYVPHRIAPHPPSGGDSQDSGAVQSGSPHSTRITNGSRLKIATAMAVRPTTLESAKSAVGGRRGQARGVFAQGIFREKLDFRPTLFHLKIQK